MSGHSRLRRSLRLSIQASPHSEFAQVKPYNITPESSSPGSTIRSLSTDSTASSTGYSTDSDWRICSVLCLHDYTSDDPTHLSFSRNEILEIVQQEDSGWWAALRLPENHIGWISRSVVSPCLLECSFTELLSAFVEPLSFELAERLRNIPRNLRIQEYESEQSNFAQVADSLDPISQFSDALDNDGHFLPNIEKVRCLVPFFLLNFTGF
jgi:son of sevenless